MLVLQKGKLVIFAITARHRTAIQVSIHQNVRCGIFGRTFKTNRRLLQHLNFCRRQNSDLQQTVIEPEVRSSRSYDYNKGHSDENQESFYWNEVARSRFEALVHDVYEKIIQWKKYIYLCCQQVLLARNIQMKPCVSLFYG